MVHPRWGAPAVLVLLLVVTSSVQGDAAAAPHEPVVGLPCENCDGIFVGMPARIGWDARITQKGLAGEPLIVEGTVKDKNDQPVPGVVVYAYQTNADGVYPPDDRTKRTAAEQHGALRGWAKTDGKGRYRFTTIRPGADPASDAPQIIHLQVLEPGRCTYEIGGVHFDDDARLDSPMRLKMMSSRGGRCIAKPAKDPSGRWRVQRDIQLGMGIPDYEQCGGKGP